MAEATKKGMFCDGSFTWTCALKYFLRSSAAAVPAESDSDSVEPTLVLSEDDLPTLLDLLHDVAHKWEEIATFLNFSQGAISVIKYKEAEPQKNLMEIMRKWLMRTNPVPTVMALVDTLRRPFINEQKLALEVEKHFYQNTPGILLCKGS